LHPDVTLLSLRPLLRARDHCTDWPFYSSNHGVEQHILIPALYTAIDRLLATGPPCHYPFGKSLGNGARKARFLDLWRELCQRAWQAFEGQGFEVGDWKGSTTKRIVEEWVWCLLAGLVVGEDEAEDAYEDMDRDVEREGWIKALDSPKRVHG